MRFALLLALAVPVFGASGCTAPVTGGDDEDGGFIPPDAGDPERCWDPDTLCVDEDGHNVCVPLLTDEDHCGECGNQCAEGGSPLGDRCHEGECSCGDTGALCDGTPTSTCCVDRDIQCFDLTTALNHCGRCSHPCGMNPDESDHCEDSVCVCGDLGEGCDGTLQSTCCMDDEEGTGARCANLLSDEPDCGECGTVCQAPVGDRCRNGQCVCGESKDPKDPAGPCPEGEECCGLGKTAACVAAGSCG